MTTYNYTEIIEKHAKDLREKIIKRMRKKCKKMNIEFSNVVSEDHKIKRPQGMQLHNVSKAETSI